ncbi:hypothetical protein DSBG_3196 [Desulfosporosinus sp. BG]|nr:hypothetical protein DSBG_3196 [Desulfosporosinus sp. BG]
MNSLVKYLNIDYNNYLMPFEYKDLEGQLYHLDIFHHLKLCSGNYFPKN